tara:strand:+ start:9804 stop:11345 length:1542 start_codon:yes stop_codon:yes gene_type:complete
LKTAAIVLLLVVAASVADARVVEIRSGSIEGTTHDGVDRYLGVPYAAPPVGERRWRAPVPAERWVGVRPAKRAAPACAQIGNFYASADESTFEQVYGSEDCLYLNVWAPEADGQRRPVLLFFHGGSGIFGNAAHPLYDGERLARELDAVVVTANYRLGVLGSLQSPALQTGDPAEDAGSFYLLDMIRVLDWLHENCSVFACDENRLTISGQSAGAVSVLALLRSPLAAGKFHGAISFSGLPFSSSSDQAQERTGGFVAELLIDNGDAQSRRAARKKWAAMSAEAQRQYLYHQSAEVLLEASGYGLVPLPLADGHVLMSKDKPDSIGAEVVSHVPLMIGKVRNEMSTLIRIKGKGRSPEKLWPLFNGEPREETVNQALGLWNGPIRNISIALAESAVRKTLRSVEQEYSETLPAVYVYRFVWENYPNPWKVDFGAFHSLDIPFIFGNFIDDREMYMRFAWTPENRREREALHKVMVTRLKAFVHTGDPNRADSNLPYWQARGSGDYTECWGCGE